MRKSGNALSQITEGVIWKQLLIFFFPILLGTFFQQFYNTIDSIIVGRFVGKEALASVGGSAAQILNLVIGFFTGLGAGASVIISQFYGARDAKGLNESLHTAYAFSIVGSVIMMILGIVFSPLLLRVMNTSKELMAGSTGYLRIYFAGILFVFIYNIGSAILRALGDSKRPLYYLIICCMLNVVLDLVFVIVFRMGVAGVAIATVLAQAVSAVLVTRALIKSEDIYEFSLRNIRFHKRVLKSQLYVGFPGGLQSVMYSLSNIIIQTALNGFGTNTTAAWAAFGKIDALFWMTSGAFGVAITTFVGQNYGAGKYDRVRKSVRVCLVMDAIATLALVAFMFILRRFLFGIFTTDEEVIRIGIEMLELIAPCFITFLCIEVLSGALRGISDVIIPMLLTMFGVCALRILWVIFAVPLHHTISMVIMSYPIAWVTTSVLFVIYYLHRMKRLKPVRRDAR